jgi:hypothetical protein
MNHKNVILTQVGVKKMPLIKQLGEIVFECLILCDKSLKRRQEAVLVKTILFVIKMIGPELPQKFTNHRIFRENRLKIGFYVWL